MFACLSLKRAKNGTQRRRAARFRQANMTAPLHDRRSFVTGEAGQDELARAVLGDEPVPEPEWFDAGPTVRLGKVAMACDVEVVLNPVDGGFLSVASEALDRIDAAESLYSVYRPETELSRLNREAANGPVEVSPELYALLRRARELAERTEGAFSPTSGPLVALWRRCRGEGRLPSDEELAAALDLSDLRNVRFDDEQRTIAFTRPGVSLHLNAMGKGAALEPAAELLEAAGCGSCLCMRGIAVWSRAESGRGDRRGRTATAGHTATAGRDGCAGFATRCSRIGDWPRCGYAIRPCRRAGTGRSGIGWGTAASGICSTREPVNRWTTPCRSAWSRRTGGWPRRCRPRFSYWESKRLQAIVIIGVCRRGFCAAADAWSVAGTGGDRVIARADPVRGIGSGAGPLDVRGHSRGLGHHKGHEVRTKDTKGLIPGMWLPTMTVCDACRVR